MGWMGWMLLLLRHSSLGIGEPLDDVMVGGVEWMRKRHSLSTFSRDSDLERNFYSKWD